MRLNILLSKPGEAKMKIRKILAQSIIEYTALVVLVSIAVGAMMFYVNRALDVKSRHLAQEMNETNR